MNPLSPFLVFRGPLELIAVIAAVLPLLIILRAWDTLPDQIPAHFGITGRPDRWGGRWQAWILPVVALICYGIFSFITGTWQWVMGRQPALPRGMELLLYMKPMIGLMLGYISLATVRVARKEAEGLNLWVMYGLLALLLAPGIALAWLAKK
ncbi:MAG: DUF1648 domain-containing protein [Bryobacteraceae bacterium]